MISLRRTTAHTIAAATALAFAGLCTPRATAEFLFYEDAPIFYSDTPSKDPIAKLVDNFDPEKLGLDTSSELAFLRSFLEYLKVPVDTQVLVFSRTSLQNDRIAPKHPRAIYYNENHYVGWVQGGDIEVIAIDPALGPIFYRINTPFGRHPEPRVFRDTQCLNCHGSSRTDGYPGMLVRSVYPDEIGSPILGAGTSRTDHSSPLDERWGGWFVTGDKAGDRHKGNIYFEEGKPGEALPIMDFGAHPRSLEKAFDTTKYLSPTSDIVALMVMEHQITAHNALIKAHLDTRRWLYIDAGIGKELGRKDGEIGESTLGLIDRGSDDLLKVMMFHGEAELEDWGVEGGERFQEAFAAGASKGPDDRSLRDLQLLSRLFKHRLSYMIYSDSFKHLHPVMKEAFYKKLYAALKGTGDPELSGHLSEKERERILGILLATKDDLPDYWKS